MSSESFVSAARAAFPALSPSSPISVNSQPYIFADNAGGSQCSSHALHALTSYLTNTNVQLGASYSVSVSATSRVSEGLDAAQVLFNAESVEEVGFAASSTVACDNIARALEYGGEGGVKAGDEIIVTGEHEANAGPWKKLAKRVGATVKFWHPRHLASISPNNPYAVGLDVEDLLPLITSKTRIVAFTATSNLLGSVVDVKGVVKGVREKAKEVGARKVEVSVDCVAYAPHRRVDVRDWDVDFCFFSLYKVYGPHISTFYARRSSLATSLGSLTHHFLPYSDPAHSTSWKIQPGGPGYELVYATTGVLEYLLSLAPPSTTSPSPSSPPTFEAKVAQLDAAFTEIAKHEQTLVQPLLDYLKSKEGRGVLIVGDERGGLGRVPTISFVVRGEKPIRSKDVVEVFDKKGGIGIRYGHFYAYTLVENLSPKIDLDDAAVRISLVHYNTTEEVQRIIEVLEEVLA